MVRDFHLSDDERDIGYFAGLVAASFSLAQFLTSVPWGIVSNHWGRRPVILIGLLGNVVTSILFGFSRSLQWAIITRACCGLLNGNLLL
jgi:MFS family permease